MRLLLDTHVFLWALTDDERLGSDVRGSLVDPRTSAFVSAASIWECAIKRGLGQLQLADGVHLAAAAQDVGFSPLAITGDHAVATEGLPDLHRDPFDRILIAQALVESLTLVTADEMIRSYPDVDILEH